MPHRNLLTIVFVAVVSYVCYVRSEQNPYARYVSTSYSVVDQWSWIDVPQEELFAGAVEGMVDVLQHHGDEHSAFISRQATREFEDEMRQQFGGIGVRISLQGEPPLPTIVGPPEPGSPAAQAEIRAGDVITAIDGESTAGMDMLGILRRMRGEVGTLLQLNIQREGAAEEQVASLVRAVIVVDSILGDYRRSDGTWQFLLDDHPRIAHVRIAQFGEKTVSEFLEVMSGLTNRGAQGIVLDVRDNAGGALQAAVLVCETFLREGQPIVETRGRDRQLRDRYVTMSDGLYEDMPLAVLINRNSASASEIVAACLQDNDRATIIGERSFGKGTVQRILAIGSRGNARLKLTSATYWRPSGVNIHRMPGDTEDSNWGVVPDKGFEVPMTDEEYLDFLERRSLRDLIQLPDEAKEADQVVAEDQPSEEDEFVDPVLERAVEHLQSVMQKSPSQTR